MINLGQFSDTGLKLKTSLTGSKQRSMQCHISSSGYE